MLLFLILVTLAFARATPPSITSEMTYTDRQAWHTFLKWPQSYEDTFLETHSNLAADDPAYMNFYPLESDWYLLEIQTYLGAYQPGYIYMAYNEKWQEGFLLSFPHVSSQNASYSLSSNIEVAGLPTFNAETKELKLFSRARGVGGCGDLSRYRFESSFAYLVEMHSQSCEEADKQGEEMILAPQDWPVIWPLQ